MLKLADITSTYRAKLIAKTYGKWVLPKTNVLDIGCGTGVVADELRKSLNIMVTGCDIDSYLIRNVPFKKMKSFSKIPFGGGGFNYSMFNDVLHHTEYENQEKLIKEALRVSKKVLLFELIPTITGKLADLLINKIHNPNMNIPYTYRDPKDWRKLFKKMGLKCKTQKVKKPMWYPFTHIGYFVHK